MEWKYNFENESWLCGTPSEGCGVYEEYLMDGTQVWTGNVVYLGQIQMIGNHPTKEDAMKAAEEILKKTKESNN